MQGVLVYNKRSIVLVPCTELSVLANERLDLLLLGSSNLESNDLMPYSCCDRARLVAAHLLGLDFYLDLCLGPVP